MSSRSFFLQRESLIGTDRLVLFCDNRFVVKDYNFIWQHKHVIDLLPADAEFLLVDHHGEQFIAAHTAHDISDKITAETHSLRSLLFKESDIERIFKRFYSNRPEKFGEHSGLGLNIVRNIIEMHDGKITASNRQDNKKGAQIKVTLPIRS